ncbi:hypothetical protein ACCAA_50048 [Candidatus Accumulibacter aalborgensis]|uniref:Uncharacterized protein n=1 Tax=Candidatus Accumulibacter aalborgensis TaxID=1860102 RepID=A0A1A8XRQ8_9PROT|nr:hypothetical protein ACCAA_50048 [Candidatus Accumulibacter aalborgensis]
MVQIALGGRYGAVGVTQLIKRVSARALGGGHFAAQRLDLAVQRFQVAFPFGHFTRRGGVGTPAALPAAGGE